MGEHSQTGILRAKNKASFLLFSSFAVNATFKMDAVREGKGKED